MKLGYSTFGMMDIAFDETLEGLVGIGYEALEIAIHKGSPYLPDRFKDTKRAQLKKMLRSAKFPPPAVTVQLSPCCQGAEREKMLASFADACKLAADLNSRKSPAIVACMPIDEYDESWPGPPDLIPGAFSELAAVAVAHHAICAIKPALVEPLNGIEQLQRFFRDHHHEGLGLNLELGLLVTDGLDLETAVGELIGLSVYAQVRDCSREFGDLDLLMPGDGGFDYPTYMVAMKQAGYKGIICAQVPACICATEEYDPWTAAEYCLDMLREARDVAECGWD